MSENESLSKMTDKPRATNSGREPEIDEPGAPAAIDPESGQHKDHWVLPEEERAKGFIRPVRKSYQHTKCGGVTSMPLTIAETYARDPKYYGSTFCYQCKEYLPVGEFVWDGTDEIVGS